MEGLVVGPEGPLVHMGSMIASLVTRGRHNISLLWLPQCVWRCLTDTPPHDGWYVVTPFLAKELRITSCAPPEVVYSNVLTDTERLDQLNRRFPQIIETVFNPLKRKFTQKCPEGNTKPLCKKARSD